MSETNAYRARFERVLRHIEECHGSDLTLEALAEQAAFSKFHFHRQFTAFFGIGVFRYVQMIRMKQAAHRLAFHTDPIIEIALDCGYDDAGSFARAFKKVTGQSPSGFRAAPDFKSWETAYDPVRKARQMMPAHSEYSAEIVTFPETRVARTSHRGDPALIGATIARFIAWRKAHGLPPSKSATFNLFYGNPDHTPPEEFRLDICAGIGPDLSPDTDEIIESAIPEGRCAKLRLIGPDESFHGALFWLYRTWLPSSGEEPRDFPLFCQRVRFYPEVPENEAVTDFYLPLK